MAGSDCRTSSIVARTPGSFWLTPVISAIVALISSNVRTPITDASGKSCGVGAGGTGGGGREKLFVPSVSNVRKNSSSSGPFSSGKTVPRFSSVWPVSAEYEVARDPRVEVREALADARFGAVQADAHAADVEAVRLPPCRPG